LRGSTLLQNTEVRKKATGNGKKKGKRRNKGWRWTMPRTAVRGGVGEVLKGKPKSEVKEKSTKEKFYGAKKRWLGDLGEKMLGDKVRTKKKRSWEGRTMGICLQGKKRNQKTVVLKGFKGFLKEGGLKRKKKEQNQTYVV